MKRFFVLLIFACVQAEDLGITRHIQPCLAQSVERILFDESLGQKFDCSSLPSEMQSVLALQMTFCHLNSTGIDPTSICSLPTLDDRRSDCLKNISRNPFAYLTYTNFLPHVQSLCYAMETQRWHHHARDTASHLHRHSNQIENEARNLLVEQETIQSNLDQTLLINQNAVDDALSVDRFLQVAQSDVDDLRGHLYVKDKAQIELIHQILETLFNIQSTLFTDAFGLSSYIFYALSLLGIHLLTIPERTNDSKFWLILLWVGFIGLERYLLMFSSYSQMLLYDLLWRLRQFWFLLSCSMLAYYGVRYRNYARENQQLIDQIDRKHKQLELTARKCLNVINQLDIINDSMADDPLNDSFDSNATSASLITLTDDELNSDQ